jgi:hypothetical protein
MQQAHELLHHARHFITCTCLKLNKCVPQFCLYHGDTRFPFLGKTEMSHDTKFGKWVSFKTLPKFLAHSDMIPLLLHTLPVGHKFGKNPSHVLIVFQISLNWSKWNSQHVTNLTDKSLLGLQSYSPSLNSHFNLFFSTMNIPSIWYLCTL